MFKVMNAMPDTNRGEERHPTFDTFEIDLTAVNVQKHNDTW
jgi:hypothetical protein